VGVKEVNRNYKDAFFGVDAIVGGGLIRLAVLAAEVMTVTKTL
jgi:hypothetical protein